MPFVRFDRDFDYDFMGQFGPVTVAYKAGTIDKVPEAHAAAAEAAGAGVRVKDKDVPEQAPGQNAAIVDAAAAGKKAR